MAVKVRLKNQCTKFWNIHNFSNIATKDAIQVVFQTLWEGESEYKQGCSKSRS